MEEGDKVIREAWNLVSQLERLSADSYWAHKASGIRGSLLKCLDQVESQDSQVENSESYQKLHNLSNLAFEVIVKAARSIQAPEK
jgi:hypothetical protein